MYELHHAYLNPEMRHAISHLSILIWESQSSDSLCDSEQGLLVKY